MRTDGHNRHTEEHSRAWGMGRTLQDAPPPLPAPRGSLRSTWEHAHRPRGRAPSGPGTPGAPSSPAGSPSVRARWCVSPPVGGEVRTAPGAARMRGAGERLPWRVERGRILMGRPGVLPPCRLTASSYCFLPRLRSHPGPLLVPRAPHSKGLSPMPGSGGSREPLAQDPRLPRSPQRRPSQAGRRAWGAAGLPCLDGGIKRAPQGTQLGAQVLL